MGKKFLKWLKAFRPPFVLSVICAAIFSGLSLCFASTNWFVSLPVVVSYAVYACAAVFLGLAIWAVVLLLMTTSPRQQFLEVTGKNRFTAKFTRNYTFRTMIISLASLMFNIILSASKMFAGWFYSSTWLIVLAGYYLILCVSKTLLLRYGRKLTLLTDKKEALVHEWKAFRLSGIMLLVLTVFLQGVVIMIVRDGSGFSYNEIMVITIAAYDFYCLGNAIYFLIAKRKNHTPIVNSLKRISLAGSLVSILSLQTAMFSSFGGADDNTFKTLLNICTGTFVCAFLIVLGILSIRKANVELRKIAH
ncbi:MAG: hypothetical protein EOM40_05945 [Clostridia bacterium]|nr:hypothetical protein [Clostridia bacterium]NCC44098.1 hypothetical protein [Clostridia bacterium]